MKKVFTVLFALAILLSSPVAAQSSSYLDSVYQTYTTASDTDPVAVLKQSISDKFQIEIANDPDVNQWTVSWLTAVNQVLTALPESFRSATRMIYLDPTIMQFEVRYNGFNNQHGIVQMGYGSMYPSNVYTKKFQATYGRAPNSSEKLARFKSILVRGMSYSFQQENPDLLAAYSRIATQSKYPTKVYGPGAELNMVVAPGKTPAMIDMAFATAEYCSSASTLQSKYQSRHAFIKEQVMGGKSVSGWTTKPLDDQANDNDNNTPPGETPGTRPPPAIPEGDYMPVVTQVDVGTAAATIPAEQKAAPDLLKSAIVELFGELPKFFSTCTEAISYLPTTDTETAFSSEGYVFITQNSWFMPSFVELDDASRAKRFKHILLREMTLRFLYFHPTVTQKWKDKFDKQQSTFDACVDMCQAVVAYYSASAWLKQLNPERYNFIKTVIIIGKEFP